MASSSSEITVLLMLEAIDKASQILEAIGGKMQALGDAAQEAADKASLSGEELEAMQVKAEAAANAAAAAADAQAAAQDRLAVSTQAVRDAQAAQAAAAAELAEAGTGYSDEIVAQYAAMSDAASADAAAVEASGARIEELQEKLATVYGAAADSVQGALDREAASYTELAEVAQVSADALAEAFSDADAKVLAGWKAQSDAAAEAAGATKAAVAEQVAALDALGDAQKDLAARTEESKAAADAANTSFDLSGTAMKGAAVTATVTAAAVAGIAYESTKAAASFQSATSVLVTSGGETQQNIAMVRQGILNLASSTGTATQELTNGMYMIGSAGYTGAQGLNVLKAAAQGAKAENADLGTVSNALTTVLKDYYGTSLTAAQATKDSTAAMDQMIAVVSSGKTTTEALSGALSTVLPIAAQTGLTFNQVGGAIATMTGEGISAQQATQDLASTITHLQNPSNVMVNEMAAMGLNASTVSKNLGKAGLTGTVAELTSAITSHMGPAGTVLQSAFNQSSAAAQDAQIEFTHLGSAAQSLAKQYESGAIGEKAFRADAQALGGTQGALALQFETAYNKSKSFNDSLTSGSPAAQTYIQALTKMTGTSEGLSTVLALSGSHAATFNANVKSVGDAASSAGTDVNGWALIQGNMNQKMDELKQTVEAASIQLGTALLPMVTKLLDVVMHIVTPIAQWIEQNKTLAAVLLLVVGALATGITVFVMAVKVITMVREAMIAFGVATEGLEFNPVIAAITVIAVLALLIITHWSTVKKWLSDFWNWLKSVFDDGVRFVKGHVNELAAAFAILLGPIGMVIAAALEIATHWKEVEKVLAEVWGWIEGAAKAIAGAVSKAWDDAFSFVKRMVGDFVNDCIIDWGLLKKGWDDTGGKLIAGIEHAWDQVSAAFDKEWSKISGDLSSIWGSLVTIWNATGGALISVIEEGVQDVVGFVSANWATFKQIFEDVLKPVEAVMTAQWDVIKAIFTGAFNVIKGATQAWWNIMSGLFRAAWDVIRGIVQVGWDVISGIFTVAWALISSSVKAGWDVVSGIFKAAWDVVVGVVKIAWDGITSTINAALDIVKGVFEVFADVFTGKWGKAWNDIKSTFTTVWDDIKNFFSEILGNIESTVSGAVSHIWTGFIGAIHAALSGIAGALADVWHTIVHAFDDAGTWLLDAGKNIIQGLINGVENMADAAVKAVKNVGSDIIKGAKSVLSIFSPSREFADIGSMTIAGFVQGIEDAAPTLHAAMAKAASSITGPSITASLATDARSSGSTIVSAAAAGIGAAAGSGMGGGAGTIIQVSVTGNTIMSDGDADKLAQKIAKRLTTTTLGQAGVKMPMAGR